MQATAEETMQTTIPGVTACGLDVHKDKIDACVRIGDGSAEGKVIIRTFSAMRKALFELRDWLVSLKCFKVLMESTGVYWTPVYWVLEEANGMNVGVGNARDLKNAPGRPKTDKEDAKWLSRLCMFGLVLKSFVVASSPDEQKIIAIKNSPWKGKRGKIRWGNKEFNHKEPSKRRRSHR